MAESHITEFHTHKDEQSIIVDLVSQEDQDFDNQHDRQLMAPKHDTGRRYHNPNNPQSTREALVQPTKESCSESIILISRSKLLHHNSRLLQ